MPLHANPLPARRGTTRPPASAVPASGGRLGHALVRVLDHLPDCLDHLPPAQAQVALRRCVAPKVVLPRGVWRPPADPAGCGDWLGLLVTDGLLTRTVQVDGLHATELLGPGDVLRPWDDDGSAHTVPALTSWRVAQRAGIAVLDERFAASAMRWPAIVSCLLSAAVHRSDARSVLLAVARARRADDRLMLLFWHLAERWGRMTPHGVRIPMALTHALLGDLVCLRRPTVSMALAELVADGRIERARDGTWTIVERRGYASARDREAAAA